MSEYKFEQNEIPYDVLAQFGLSRNMIEDLPVRVMDNLTEGRRTPALPIKIDGELRCYARIALIPDGHGQADVIFFPQLAQSDLSNFSEQDQDNLRQGKAVIADMTTPDGHQVKAFHRIDEITSQVQSVPTPVIAHNAQILADEFRLHNAETLCLLKGEPLTVIEGDTDVTFGIDLNSPAGIRICKGDLLKWKEQPKREYAKYNFGIFGCWTVDDKGNFDYIEEENYSEELWDEMKKSGVKRAAANVAHKI